MLQGAHSTSSRARGSAGNVSISLSMLWPLLYTVRIKELRKPAYRDQCREAGNIKDRNRLAEDSTANIMSFIGVRFLLRFRHVGKKILNPYGSMQASACPQSRGLLQHATVVAIAMQLCPLQLARVSSGYLRCEYLESLQILSWGAQENTTGPSFREMSTF